MCLMEILSFIGIIVGFIALMLLWGAAEWCAGVLLCWAGRMLLRLGIIVYDASAMQVKAYHKRGEEHEAMLQDPQQMLVRPSAKTADEELLHPAAASPNDAEHLLLPIVKRDCEQ